MLIMPYYTNLTDCAVSLKISAYKGKSHNLCIQLYLDTQPYCSLTINTNEPLPPFHAYIDTDSLEWSVDFICDNKIGYYAGKTRKINKIEYPLFAFYPDRISECNKDDY